MSFLKKLLGKWSPQESDLVPSPSSSSSPAAHENRENQPETKPKQGALEQVRHLIAVGSGKGGVGKSTVALNLAVALAEKGLKVGIVDADIHGPSLQKMTNAPRPEVDEENRMIPPIYAGVKVMSVALFAADGQAQLMRGPMVTQVIRQFLTQVAWGELDYLVIDMPPGTGDIHLSLAQMVPLSGAVLVTTPQEMSLIDVRRAVHMFQTLNVPIVGVVENMSYFLCEENGAKHYLFGQGGGAKLAQEIGAPLLASLPIDPRVTSSGDVGKAFVLAYPSSEVAQAYTRFAEQFETQRQALSRSGDGALGYFMLEWK